MSIANLYTKNPVTIDKDAPLEQAIHLMRDIYVSDVVVTEQIAGHEEPLGIITERELLLKVIDNQLSPSDLCAKDIITESLVTIFEYDDIETCIKLMQEHRRLRLPVVDADGILCGIITSTDCLQFTKQLIDAIVTLNDAKV